MATIRIYDDETDGELFPRMCLRCGADADHDVSQTFAWMPPWVHILILAGLAPWLIVCLILRKSMRVRVPMCERHRNHWRNRKLLIWLGLLFWVLVGVAGVVLLDRMDRDSANMVLAVGLFGGLFWLVLALILVNQSIRAGEITDRWIELVHVHRDFRDTWNEVQPKPVPVVRRPRRRLPPRDEYEDDEGD
ncbi:MAG TPA: hypothetical protein VKE74_31195 [Gemmataceae bacterium]|nr:hypothetical protein [Gemmataceae bacterium]